MKNTSTQPMGRGSEISGAGGEASSYPVDRVPKLLSIEEVADRLGVSIPYIYKLMSAGRMEYVRIPGAEPNAIRCIRRVSADYLERFIEAATVNKVA